MKYRKLLTSNHHSYDQLDRSWAGDHGTYFEIDFEYAEDIPVARVSETAAGNYFVEIGFVSSLDPEGPQDEFTVVHRTKVRPTARGNLKMKQVLDMAIAKVLTGSR